ncbi:M15 family metallopeptidase [soil metagenome]
MTILLSDDRVRSIPLLDSGEPLVRLDARFGPARARVRAGVAERLSVAQEMLPAGIHLKVVEGHRSATDQLTIIDRYTAELRAAHPGRPEAQIVELASRYVSPLDVAPHVAAAAVDVTLVDLGGRELDLGTPIDATPEESEGRCFFNAPDLDATARANREMLACALSGGGLVNYPTEWWHWSYGDRYWALVTGAPAALYGGVS